MMTLLSVQDGLATLIALGAGAILLRRFFGFARSSSESPCAHCSSSPAKKSRPGVLASGLQTTVFPLTLVRSSDTTSPSASLAAPTGTAPGRSRHS